MTENGLSVVGEDGMSDGQAVRDSQRVDFYKNYVGAATDAVLVDKVYQGSTPVPITAPSEDPLLAGRRLQSSLLQLL